MGVIEELLQMKKDINEAIAALPTMPEEIGTMAAQFVYIDINDIFEDGIQQYYGAYSPVFYKRTNSLMKAFKVNIHGSEVSWESNASLVAGSHRVGSSYIYMFMFEEGYHGGAIGANASGGAMWRTPPYGPRPWATWGRPAVQTESPSDIIDQKLGEYENSGAIIGYLEDATAVVLSRYRIFNY